MTSILDAYVLNSWLYIADKRDDGSAEISYAVNGRFLGYAFQISTSNKPLFPHISIKNMKFTVCVCSNQRRISIVLAFLYMYSDFRSILGPTKTTSR